MRLGPAVSAAVSAASPLASPAEHSKRTSSRWCMRISGVATRAWACGCMGTPARGPPLSPLKKVLQARLRGRDPSTGWAGPCAIERTPSRVRRAPSATPTMNTARPSRARSSFDLRKRTRRSQLAESITRICAGRAGMRRSKSALTLQVWWRCLNGHLGTLRHSADNFGSSDAAAANLQRMGVPVKALEPRVSSLARTQLISSKCSMCQTFSRNVAASCAQ